MAVRVRDCDAFTRAGRLRKAEQFLTGAQTLAALSDDPAESADAQVTLLVTAGIAAADVICCARLGQYSVGDDHAQAVKLLERADAGVALHLARLIGMKSKAAYTEKSVSASDRLSAERAAAALVERARTV